MEGFLVHRANSYALTFAKQCFGLARRTVRRVNERTSDDRENKKRITLYRRRSRPKHTEERNEPGHFAKTIMRRKEEKSLLALARKFSRKGGDFRLRPKPHNSL